MSRADRPGAPAAFWRCGRCGTPNPWASYLTNCVGCGAPRPPRAVAAEPSPPADLPAARVGPRVWGGGLLAVASWGYVGLVLAVLATIRWGGDRWWPATLLMFAPRWPFLLPVVALAAAAGWARRPGLWLMHAATAWVVLVPLMGLSLPVGRLWAGRPEGPRLRVLSYNRGSTSIDGEALVRLIERERLDVLCFQEVGSHPALEAFLARGWYRDAQGMVYSRYPILDDKGRFPETNGDWGFYAAMLSRVRLRIAPGWEVAVASVHLPTMHFALDALREGDPDALTRHSEWRWARTADVVVALQEIAAAPLLVAGDFNMPSDSPIFALMARGFRIGFDEAGWGFGYTRPAAFPWMRIDHVLASPEWTFTRCWVGPDLGSDHLPVIAEVVLTRK